MAESKTPSELQREITVIIAQECGCTASWAQHPQPVNDKELDAIFGRILDLLAPMVVSGLGAKKPETCPENAGG